LAVKKEVKKMLATSLIFKKLSKVNNHSVGEYSPNLVTLFTNKSMQIG
jgi:hypothetical protein